MLKFLIKLFFMFVVFFTPILTIYIFADTLPEDHMIWAFSDKLDRLEAHKNDPKRLILVGDSNLLLGIDSEVLENNFDVPVVNLSGSGSLGALFYINLIEKHVKKGDVVLLSANYTQFAEYYEGSGNHLSLLIKSYPSFMQYISSIKQWDQVLGGVPKLVKESMKRFLKDFKFTSPGSVYARHNINKWGDYVGHHNEPLAKKRSDGSYFSSDHFSKKSKGLAPIFNRLTSFMSRCETVGAACYFMYSAYPKELHLKYAEEIRLLQKNVSKSFGDKVLGSADDFVFENKLFFDSPFHLGLEGKTMRTKKIVDLLKTSSVME